MIDDIDKIDQEEFDLRWGKMMKKKDPLFEFLQKGIFVLAIILFVGIITGAVFLGTAINKEVKEHGLKGIVEEIWEGEE